MTGVQKFFLLLTLWLVTLSLLPFFTDPGRWVQIAVLEGASLQHAFGPWEGEIAGIVTEGIGAFWERLLLPFRILYGWNGATYWESLNGAWQVGKTTSFGSLRFGGGISQRCRCGFSPRGSYYSGTPEAGGASAAPA